MKWSRMKLLVWKEILQLRRDRMLLPLAFIQPVLMVLMFGYVVGSDVTNIPTAIVDQDRSAVSRELAASFENTGYFTIRERVAEESAIQPLMDANDIQVAVLIPPGLERDLQRGEQVPLQVIVDGSDSKTASVATGYATRVIADYVRQRIEATGLMPETAEIDARVRVLFNPSLSSVNAMIPALVAYILMLASVALMAQAVVREREQGTLEQMFVTPITRGEYIFGKMVPYVMLAAIQIVAVMLVGVMWFRVPFNGDLLVIGSGMTLFVFITLGQGLIISTISKTRQQAQQWTMFLLIPTVVLSGFIFPIESMPPEVVPVTYLIPLRYAVIVLRGSFMKGAGFEALWPEFLAMAIFAVLIFTFAIARFQKRLTD